MKAWLDKSPIKIEMTENEAEMIRHSLLQAAHTTTEDWGQRLMWLYHILDSALDKTPESW